MDQHCIARAIAPLLIMGLSTGAFAQTENDDKEETTDDEEAAYTVIVYQTKKTGRGGGATLTWYIPTAQGWSADRFNTEINFNRDALEGKGLSAAIACQHALEFFMHHAASTLEARDNKDLAGWEKHQNLRDSYLSSLSEKCDDLLPDVEDVAEQLGNVYSSP